MKIKANFVVAISAGIAMTFLVGCAPTTHVTETTTTRQYDTTNPPIVVAPGLRCKHYHDYSIQQRHRPADLFAASSIYDLFVSGSEHNHSDDRCK